MDNLFFKYGVIMVGVVVIVLLMSFAYTSLSRTIVSAEEREQNLKGDLFQLKDRIQELCDNCLKVDVNRECFVLYFEVPEAGEICQDKFGADVSLPECIGGKGVLKIDSQDKACIVKLVSKDNPESRCLECDNEDCCSTRAITDNCFWQADGTTCIDKDCAALYHNGCESVNTQECCDSLAWACSWEGAGCVTK
jgi:hypothetical protein